MARVPWVESIKALALGRGKARVKRTIVTAVPPDGTAVLNANDPLVAASTYRPAARASP